MTTTPLTRTLVAMTLGAAVLAGCGGDGDGATDAGVDDAGNSGDAAGGSGGDDGLVWPTAENYGTGGQGTVTVDGTEYGIDEVRLCDVTDYFVGDGREASWRMQGVGAADPEADYERYTELVEIDVLTGTDVRDQDLFTFGWDGPEGIYDVSLLGADITFEVADDRVTGTGEGRSHLGNPPVELTVDVAVPEGEAEDCS